MRRISVMVVSLTLAGIHASGLAQAPVPIARFVEAASDNQRTSEQALRVIQADWRDGYAALLLELVRFMRPRVLLARRTLPHRRQSTNLMAGAGPPRQRWRLVILARRSAAGFCSFSRSGPDRSSVMISTAGEPGCGVAPTSLILTSLL